MTEVNGWVIFYNYQVFGGVEQNDVPGVVGDSAVGVGKLQGRSSDVLEGGGTRHSRAGGVAVQQEVWQWERR